MKSTDGKKTLLLVGSDPDTVALAKYLSEDDSFQTVGILWGSGEKPTIQYNDKINILDNLDSALKHEIDIVFNLSKDKELTNRIFKEFGKNTEIVNYQSTLLLLSLLRKNKKTENEIKELLKESRELYSIGLSITASDNLDDALNTILIEACRSLKVPAGSITLYEDAVKLLMLKACYGFSPDFKKVTEWHRRSGGLTDTILNKRVPTVINNVENHKYVDNEILLKEGVKSILAAPLYAEDKVVGILYLDDFVPRQWTRVEIEFITLIGIQAAHAIEKFKLIDDLTRTTNYLNDILKNSADMIITTDINGNIVEFNPAGTRLLGYTKEEMVGLPVENIWVEPMQRKSLIERVFKESYVSNFNTLLKKKDGSHVEISLTISALRDEHGKIIGTVGISKDITNEKKLAKALELRNMELQKLNESLEEKVIERTQDLQKANRELERSNKLKSQFIATMSHELRTPLNSILGFSDLLLDEIFGPLSEKQKRYIKNINNSGNHLLQLINNVLDIAKIESGKMELCYETFDPYLAVTEVETVIKPLIEKKKLNLSITTQGNVGFISADKVKFKQILYNLLSNAIKFTDDGGSINVILRQVQNPHHKAVGKEVDENILNYLEVVVEDTGIGIKEEDQKRIFSEFEQVDSNLSRKYEGTGLGLSLTKSLI
ncbi:MAG: PAS domain S-box protein [Thermodesulfovibrionales bacterium]|nr:PAS domain S-box protein [Thermodesulfovibrionales bacterium]